MSTNAGELLKTMRIRLKMQEEGLTNPAQSVKIATKALVEKLAYIDPSEDIDIIIGGTSVAKYIRASTGELLAEINKT